jgi:hypothetical protein
MLAGIPVLDRDVLELMRRFRRRRLRIAPMSSPNSVACCFGSRSGDALRD